MSLSLEDLKSAKPGTPLVYDILKRNHCHGILIYKPEAVIENGADFEKCFHFPSSLPGYDVRLPGWMQDGEYRPAMDFSFATKKDVKETYEWKIASIRADMAARLKAVHGAKEGK